ncbi:MAG: exodeoxyribonuclease I [Deltaproteobacteria bacterium]|jgi:exodeoxyribonuclease-1|nr:exodeoxyribonuclease I [Deltaproteobacteria bacterium]
MKKTYLFYDIETTGLNKAFDQVLQFAAIRTDRQLNEIERYRLTVKLRPDVIPSPGAMITNRLSIEDLASGLGEFEAIGQIHELMNQPETISLGYNSIGFDDEFLRFSFHRNLLPPYTHQFQNGCRRMDLLPIAVMFWLYKRDVITWPQIQSKPSLKLEHIREANQLSGGPAHDAGADVAATAALARRFFKKKKMWNYLMGYFEKETDAHRIGDIAYSFESALGKHRQALMVSSEYGPQQMYQIPVLSIGNSIPYSNQTLWLRLDLPELRETKADAIDESTWIVRKRYGEPGILLPPNQRYLKFLSDGRKAAVAENLNWLQSNPSKLQQIVNYHREYTYPFIPNLDPDAALYQIGFFSRSDEKLFKEFQAATLNEKEAIARRLKSQDARSLAVRLLGRNYPQQLSPDLAGEFEAYLRRVNPDREDDAIVDYRKVPRMTPSAALAEIRQLIKSGGLDNHQKKLLDDLQKYIKTNFPKRKAGRQLPIGDNF